VPAASGQLSRYISTLAQIGRIAGRVGLCRMSVRVDQHAVDAARPTGLGNSGSHHHILYYVTLNN
jgi:hypothetical protein